MPAHEEINEFQKVVLEGFQGGRLADLAELEDYKTLTARLKKETGTAVLAAVLLVWASAEVAHASRNPSRNATAHNTLARCS